ncbi:hypothetical protein KCU98_g21149, partial [Aureobasidium melanogenum]
VPIFAHWRFPHGDLPSSWSQLRVPNMPPSRALPRQGSLTDALLARDISCRLTATVESTEHGHLVPLFDQRRFAITLKPLPVASDSAATHGLAVHLFSSACPSSLPNSTMFLEQGTKRALYIVHDGETSDQEVNADQCIQLYLSCKSRSLSLSKRKRDTGGSVQEGECDAEGQEDEDEDEDEDEGRYRGRARLRSSSCLAASESTAFQALLAVTDTTSTVTHDLDASSSADPRVAPYAGARNDLPV